jgi:hypothetical protein
MSADASFAVEFLGFVIAVSLVAFGVWKLDIRLFGAGATLAGLTWLCVSWSSPIEWTGHELITLRVRPVDSATGESVAGAVFEQTETTVATGRSAHRLPTKIQDEKDPEGDVASVVVMSLAVEVHVTGSLHEQRQQPQAHVEVVNQRLQITAPRYRPWRGGVKELLPRGWPATISPDKSITIRLERE